MRIAVCPITSRWPTRSSRAAEDRKALAPAPPLNPQLPLYELSSRLPDNCIITSDSSSVVTWAARHLLLRRGMMMSVSGGLATMGSALPYALAAKFAYPDRIVIATAGDGAMQMNGNAGLIDVAKHWRTWSDPRLVVLVLNNRDLNFVTWEQRVMEGEPRFEESQALPDFPFEVRRVVRAEGYQGDRPEAVGAAWDEALASDRPVVIEAFVSADVPTVPPDAHGEESTQLGKALNAGDPAAAAVRTQMRQQEIDEEPAG